MGCAVRIETYLFLDALAFTLVSDCAPKTAEFSFAFCFDSSDA
jgi:hypothetical protein